MARWYDGKGKPHDEPYTGQMTGSHAVIPKPEPKWRTEPPVDEVSYTEVTDGGTTVTVTGQPEGLLKWDAYTELHRYKVVLEVSIDGEDLHEEPVFARSQMTAVARAAWNAALKGYSVFDVRSAEIG